jgi:acyl-CoA thioesterase-1
MAQEVAHMKEAMQARIYGDSVMKGTVIDRAYRYHALMEEYLTKFREKFSIETENRSRFGITVDKGYSLLCQDLDQGVACDYALVEFGGNDCNFKWNEISVLPESEHEPLTRLSHFKETYHSMVRDLKRANIQPVLMTLPPIDAERYLAFLGRNGNDPKQILRWLGDVQRIYRFHESYSNAIVRIAEETGCPLVDVRGYFLDQPRFRDLICIDGVHPSEAGYKLIFQAFTDFISNNPAAAC